MVQSVNEKRQSYSSPHAIDQLDQIPTPFLKFLVVLGPTLRTVAKATQILRWKTSASQSILVVSIWILLCLHTWAALVFGIPSFVLYKLASDWFATRTCRARREALEEERLKQRLLAQKKTPDDDDDDERVLQQRLQQQQEEEQEALISRKVIADHVSLDDTLQDLAVVNAWIDAVGTQLKGISVYLDEQRAVAVLSALMYVWPMWVLLCWALDTRGVLALVGAIMLIRPSPWYQVAIKTTKQNAVLRCFVASLWGYGVALVETSLYPWKSWKGVRGWFSLVWKKGKAEKAKTIEVMKDQMTITSKDERTRSEMIFQFEVFENQRWWLGVKWTTNMMASERRPWTDNQMKPISGKEDFNLPEATVENIQIDSKVHRTVNKVWSWVDGNWWVDMTGESNGQIDHNGWAYGNNAWKQLSGTPGMQSYTRTRKWCRRAKLVVREVDEPISNDKKND